jgi:hypothetical protein
MHTNNNGDLFSAIHCRLAVNPVTLNTQQYIISNHLKGNRWEEILLKRGLASVEGGNNNNK